MATVSFPLEVACQTGPRANARLQHLGLQDFEPVQVHNLRGA